MIHKDHREKMTDRDDLPSWSEYLNQIFPATGVLVAGSGIGSMIDILDRWVLSTVMLIEADKKQIKRMYAMHRVPEHWQILDELLWERSVQLPFYRLSNPALNGTVSSAVLSVYWKNVTTVETEMRTTIALDQLLKASTDRTLINWFFIDCIPALPILKGGEEGLGQCDVVIARIFMEDDILSEAGTSRLELDMWMTSMGFRNVTVLQDNHPKVGLALYVRDWKSLYYQDEVRLSAVIHDRDVYNNMSTEQRSKMKAIVKERDMQAKTAKQLKEQIEELQRELEITKYEMELLKDSKETKDTDHSVLIPLFHKYKEDQKRQFDEMIEHVSAAAKEERGSLQLMEGRLQNMINKASNNSIKQIESFHSLQDYLIHGMKPLDFHGWPVSPDIALFLIQKIEGNNYDLVIEFGSGTSTLLLAKVLQIRSTDHAHNKTKRLVTFEHDQKYFEQTSLALKNQSLEEYVDIVYAPLISFTYGESDFLYYSCEDKLKELDLGPRKSEQSILVLVDGPPGATGPLARFPALPSLLNRFGGQKIHLVLDDAYRDEEKAIVKRWEQILEEQSIVFKSEMIPSEKGMYFCQIDSIC